MYMSLIQLCVLPEDTPMGYKWYIFQNILCCGNKGYNYTEPIVDKKQELLFLNTGTHSKVTVDPNLYIINTQIRLLIESRIGYISTFTIRYTTIKCNQ